MKNLAWVAHVLELAHKIWNITDKVHSGLGGRFFPPFLYNDWMVNCMNETSSLEMLKSSLHNQLYSNSWVLY